MNGRHAHTTTLILSRNTLKKVGEKRHSCRTLRVVGKPVSYEDCTSGLVIGVFDYSGTVSADVVLLHVCPQSCMPNPAEGLLEACKDVVEVLLVLEMFLRLKICSVVLLPTLKPACSLAMNFFACGFNLFSMIFSMTLLG